VRARARRILLGRPIRYSDAGVWLAGQGVAHRAPALLSSFKYGPGQPALPSIYPSPPPAPSHDSRALCVWRAAAWRLRTGAARGRSRCPRWRSGSPSSSSTASSSTPSPVRTRAFPHPSRPVPVVRSMELSAPSAS
jgi:hypothetical protein